jgi:DNA-binding beta-propeller fold protein YncE
VLSRRSFAFISLAAAAAGCRRKKSPGFNGYAYVANEAGNAITAVDLAAFAVARHIPVDGSPNAVIAHPDQSRVYALAPQPGTVYEIDTDKFSIARRVKVGPALSMRMTGGSLWVLGHRSLTQIALDSFRPTATLPLPVDAYDFDLAKNYATVSYGPAGSVSIADLNAGKVSSPVKVSDAIGLARFRPDGDGLLVADTAARQLCVLDQHAAVIVRLPLAVRPDNLCFNQDGGQLFITGEGQDAVVVIFPYYVPQVAETVLAGHAPGAMAASSTHLFIANPKAGDVTILSIPRRKIVAATAVGEDPGFIAVTPDDNYALVLNRKSGDMAVIRTAALVTDEVYRRKSAALFTMIPVGSRPVSAAVKAV